MKIGVFGLGEAGSLIATDLALAGHEVHAFDPANIPTPQGVTRHDDPMKVAGGAPLVMGVTAAADALGAMSQAWEAVAPEAIYADLATATPELERRMAGIAAASDVLFADVALMAPVLGRGLATPALASGTGAGAYAAIVNDSGGVVEAIQGEAGVASARKLTRSVVTKGLTALLVEAMEAASARGDADWMWQHLTDELTALNETFLHRLVDGTAKHGVRRVEEMRAAGALLVELGVVPTMTRATADRLARIVAEELRDASSGGKD